MSLKPAASDLTFGNSNLSFKCCSLELKYLLSNILRLSQNRIPINIAIIKQGAYYQKITLIKIFVLNI